MLQENTSLHPAPSTSYIAAFRVTSLVRAVTRLVSNVAHVTLSLRLAARSSGAGRRVSGGPPEFVDTESMWKRHSSRDRPTSTPW